MESNITYCITFQRLPFVTRKACNRVSCAGVAVFLITLLWIIQPASAEGAEWIADAEAGLLYNDNLTQSFFKSYEIGDPAFLLSMALGRYYQLTDTTRLSFTVNSWGRAHKTFDGLNSITSGITAGVKHKYGLGPDVPWIRADAYAGYMDVRDDARKGMQYTMGLRMGKRFSPRFDGSLGYVYSLRDGGDGEVGMKNIMHGIGTDVYDQTNQMLSLEVNYMITRDALLTAGYSYQTGEFDSTCSVADFETVWDAEEVRGVTADKVFGGLAYRIRGIRNIASLNFSYALSRHTSLNLVYKYQSGKGDVLSYQSSIVHAAFMYRY